MVNAPTMFSTSKSRAVIKAGPSRSIVGFNRMKARDNSMYNISDVSFFRLRKRDLTNTAQKVKGRNSKDGSRNRLNTGTINERSMTVI